MFAIFAFDFGRAKDTTGAKFQFEVKLLNHITKENESKT